VSSHSVVAERDEEMVVEKKVSPKRRWRRGENMLVLGLRRIERTSYSIGPIGLGWWIGVSFSVASIGVCRDLELSKRSFAKVYSGTEARALLLRELICLEGEKY
jgi:hypothetical protein